MPDAEDPEWLSPLLVVALCTSCVGLAAAGALVVGLAGAFWGNVLVGVAAGAVVGGWLLVGNPFRDRRRGQDEGEPDG